MHTDLNQDKTIHSYHCFTQTYHTITTPHTHTHTLYTVHTVCLLYLSFSAAFSVSDVLSDNSLHLLPQHGVLSQL